MGTSVTCPKCGAHHPAGALACTCGHSFSNVSKPPKPSFIERPFDLGKPLGSKYPIGSKCPACGSIQHKKVRSEAMIAFTQDRVCQNCSTRYTPPTPIWARSVFGVLGLGAVGFGCTALYGEFFRDQPVERPLGITPSVLAILVGLACLYKAVTK